MSVFIMDLLDVQSDDSTQQFSIVNHAEFACPQHCKFCHRFLMTDNRYKFNEEEKYFETGLKRLKYASLDVNFNIIIDLQLSYIDNIHDYNAICDKFNKIYSTRKSFNKVLVYVAVDLLDKRSYQAAENFVKYLEKIDYLTMFPRMNIYFYCSFDLWGRFNEYKFKTFCNNLYKLRYLLNNYENIFANTFAMIFMPANIRRLIDDEYDSIEKRMFLDEIAKGTNVYFSKPKELANEKGISAEFLYEYKEGITLDLCEKFTNRYGMLYDRKLTPKQMYKLLKMKENYNENASVFTLDKL